MDCRTIRSFVLFGLAACAVAAAQETPIPTATELSGRPFTIKDKWVIGGTGDWDYLTLDPTARQLFIAHGQTVQVVDIGSGSVVGTVTGFRQAHAVVLDNPGPYGYGTDGADISVPLESGVRAVAKQGKRFAGGVKVFDRRTFAAVTTILTRPSLRELALEPQTGLLFALGTDLSTLPPKPEPPSPRHPVNRPVARNMEQIPAQAGQPQAQTLPCGSTTSGERMPESVISVIDPQKQRETVDIRVCGLLGSAAPDGTGGLYVIFTSRNLAARLDASALAHMLAPSDTGPKTAKIAGMQYVYDDVAEWDWRPQTSVEAHLGDVLPQLRTIGLSDCSEPHGLAVDSRQNRLFVGCNNMELVVIDSNSGASIASFIIGLGTDSVAYDGARGLIFTANGGGYGSVTIARQHVTDTYAVIQNLPTLQQARTMAIDPSTGLVYLVTTLYGANLANPPMNGIGKLQMNPVGGSFQVLVIGN